MNEHDPSDRATACRALHLRTSAPRPLVDGAHGVLRALRVARGGDDAQVADDLGRLGRAHEAARAGAGEHEAPAEVVEHSPWELLHLERSAPPELVELAYRFRRGERAEWPRESAPALPAPPPDEPPRAPAPAPTAPVELAAPPTPTSPSDSPARVVSLAGAARPPGAAIGESPLRIGGDPTCDIVVGIMAAGRGRTEARLWRSQGRVIFHGVAGHLSVNGHAVAWAVLDPGDTVEIGDTTFRLEA